MIHNCLIKGENVFRETNGVFKLMGFIARVSVDVELPSLVEVVALEKLKNSNYLREQKENTLHGITPKLSVIGISKSAKNLVQPIEFTWFPMDEMV